MLFILAIPSVPKSVSPFAPIRATSALPTGRAQRRSNRLFFCEYFSMGRDGIEPSTSGLKDAPPPLHCSKPHDRA